MLVGGLNLVKATAAKAFPMPQGMGNSGFLQYRCPVTLVGDGVTVRLAADPLISVERANDVVRRSVAKPRHEGTVKESWGVGDWQVTIAGVIIAETREELQERVQELQWICAVRESLETICPLLNDQYDIARLAITQLQLPFTPGELNQQFTITALSDTSHQLLEEI